MSIFVMTLGTGPAAMTEDLLHVHDREIAGLLRVVTEQTTMITNLIGRVAKLEAQVLVKPKPVSKRWGW